MAQSNDIHPSLVTHKVTADDEEKNPLRIVLVAQPDGTTAMMDLPPLESIVLPKTTTKSALIRWLAVMGYSTSEIYRYLGCKYQMVRNIVTTIPKRAAREDLPNLVIVPKPETNELQDALDGVLDASLMEGRRQRSKGQGEDDNA